MSIFNKYLKLSLFCFLFGIFFPLTQIRATDDLSCCGSLNAKDCTNNSLESYCRNGIYYLNDVRCGAAPCCGGKSINDASGDRSADFFRTMDNCWRKTACDTGYCKGLVPLCCYELERTGNPNMCIWPERGYCHPSQCDKIPADMRNKCVTATDGVGDCMCGHGLRGWCYDMPVNEGGCQLPAGSVPYISLQERLGDASLPSATPSPTRSATNPTATPTRIPSPTSIPSPTPTSTPYPATGPAILPKIAPSPYPAGPYCSSNVNCVNKSKGDADCSGNVNSTDYGVWKTQYDTMIPGSQQNPNANFACVEGNSNTYFVDLIDFEVWRRNTRW